MSGAASAAEGAGAAAILLLHRGCCEAAQNGRFQGAGPADPFHGPPEKAPFSYALPNLVCLCYFPHTLSAQTKSKYGPEPREAEELGRKPGSSSIGVNVTFQGYDQLDCRKLILQ